MIALVVDTNVVLVSNGQHGAVSPGCIAECALQLQAIMRQGKLVLDDGFLILREYQNKTTPRTGNRPGDAFVKWALQKHADVRRVDLIPLQKHDERDFESFPEHPDLTDFDPPDRKFVAVANAHPSKPAILQATDSKWLRWDAALKDHAISVDFVCPEDIKRFAENQQVR